MTPPEIAVVVPSHERPVRLRWLLNALEEQTLDRGRFEVIVGHDSRGPETEELLRSHPLAVAGVLREVQVPADSAPPGKNRNAAWRVARAPIVAFTDDDCRPPRDWLERALAAARRHPGAIVQGRTRPDPHEEHLLNSPHARTQRVDPPGPFAQACNIVYPREVLESQGGFDEGMLTGEDADLALRAQGAGVEYVGAPEVLNWHAVSNPTLVGRLKGAWRWRHLPELVRRHPAHRDAYVLWVFWKRTHAFLPPAVAGMALARRNPLWGLLALPFVVHATPSYSGSARARFRALLELPGQTAVAAAEFGVLAWGSLRHRTVFL
jgi:glycosyltransferase involved in cell wall biosynthesis